MIPDSVRLAVGTLTAVRVPAPRRVNRAVARNAMLLAPLVGIGLALAAAVAMDGVRIVATAHRPITSVDFLAAALALTVLTLLTRALHLDGLADTVDGLGVKAETSTGDNAQLTSAVPDREVNDSLRARRLAVMRAPDIGAFGVVALVFTVLLQAAALTTCIVSGYGTIALLTAVVTGRLAVTWCCTSLVPAARADGLGVVVAGTVPRRAAAALTVATLAGAAALGALDDDHGLRVIIVLMASVVLGLLFAAWLVGLCHQRFGGITGDVLGAVVELTTVIVLLVVAIGVGIG